MYTWYILSHSDSCGGGLFLDGILCFLIEPELQAAARQLRREAAESYSGYSLCKEYTVNNYSQRHRFFCTNTTNEMQHSINPTSANNSSNNR